jgi:hypothetical protein
LHQREVGKGQRVLRVTVHGRRREMGLGSTQDVSLKDARVLAAKGRAEAAQGIAPIKQRERERREALRMGQTGTRNSVFRTREKTSRSCRHGSSTGCTLRQGSPFRRPSTEYPMMI